MKVVVTGGAGYIGSVTSDLLLQEGHDVVVIDDLRTGHRDLVPDGATFLNADVADPRTYGAALQGTHACLHFAAWRRPASLHAAAGGVLREQHRRDASAAQRPDRCRVDRFVLSSTCAVYGEPDALPIREDDRKQPTNVYGHSKLLIERALQWLVTLRGLRYAALRYFNAAGATDERGEDHTQETHIIPLVCRLPPVCATTSRCSAPTTPHPTARVCVTTSTWPIWPTHTSAH